MNTLKNAVTVVELCPKLAEETLQLSDNQELLLTAIASYLYYQCDEPDHSIDAVIKVLNCIGPKSSYTFKSTFDYLFDILRERVIIHPALVYYNAFARLSDQEQLALRDSCLSLLSKYID